MRSGGEFYNSRYFLCTFILGIYDNGKTECFAQKFVLLQVLGRTDTGNNMFCSEPSGSYTADHICFIAAHCCNEKIRILDSRILQDIGVCSASLYTDNIQGVGNIRHDLIAVVDYCHVVAFIGESACKSESRFSASDYNNLHKAVPPQNT